MQRLADMLKQQCLCFPLFTYLLGISRENRLRFMKVNLRSSEYYYNRFDWILIKFQKYYTNHI